MITLVKALVAGTIRYNAPFLHSASPSAIQKLQILQNVALRLCLALPQGASGNGGVVESHSKFVSVMITDESLHKHLRHETLHPGHFMTTLAKRLHA